MEEEDKPLSEKAQDLDYVAPIDCKVIKKEDVKQKVEEVYEELISNDEICRAEFQEKVIKRIFEDKFGFEL